MNNDGFDNTSETSSNSAYVECQSTCSNLYRESSTQTDFQTTVINSWKIQNIRPLKPNSNTYIVQTHNIGFNKSCQTPFREIYGRDRSELVEIVSSWRVLTVLIPSLLYFTLYFLDQLLDIIVCIEFYNQDHYWWFGLGLAFLIIPSILITIYAYEQLVAPDVAIIKPVKKRTAKVLCLFQLTPYYLIGRRLWWCLKAWTWSEHREDSYRNSSEDLWRRAEMEHDSTTVKLFQSLLESIPQLSLQSFALLQELSGARKPSTTLWLSVIINLFSASLGMASSQSKNLFERIAGSLAIFITLGSRVMICGSIGTFHSSLWITPVAAAFLIGLVTKISESLEDTLAGHLERFKKYSLEALVMASVSPPFDATGVFCSSVYFLAAVIFLMQNPSDALHIVAPFVAIFGQVLWLFLGFCIMKE